MSTYSINENISYGSSGNGKSTFAKKLANDLDALLFNADEINLTKFTDFTPDVS